MSLSCPEQRDEVVKTPKTPQPCLDPAQASTSSAGSNRVSPRQPRRPGPVLVAAVLPTSYEPCTRCPAKFNTHPDLLTHMSVEHSNDDSDEEISSDEEDYHLDDSERPEANIPPYLQGSKPVAVVKPVVICRICGETFDSLSRTLEHMFGHDSTRDTDSQSDENDSSDAEQGDPVAINALVSNLLRTYNENVKRRAESEGGRPEKKAKIDDEARNHDVFYQCFFCMEQLFGRANLCVHMLVHNTQFPAAETVDNISTIPTLPGSSGQGTSE